MVPGALKNIHPNIPDFRNERLIREFTCKLQMSCQKKTKPHTGLLMWKAADPEFSLLNILPYTLYYSLVCAKLKSDHDWAKRENRTSLKTMGETRFSQFSYKTCAGKTLASCKPQDLQIRSQKDGVESYAFLELVEDIQTKLRESFYGE